MTLETVGPADTSSASAQRPVARTLIVTGPGVAQAPGVVRTSVVGTTAGATTASWAGVDSWAGVEARSSSQGYRSRVADLLADGWTFAGLHVAPARQAVRALLAGPDGTTCLVDAPADGDRVPSVVDLVPAAGWDEREAHDRFGIRFDGHDPLRPLLDHREPLGWEVPVHGPDAHQVAVGPIHAGVIESGHFRFHVVGDRILHLDARLFYKHRGLEQAAEGLGLDEGLRYAARACGACAVSNAVAYAHACEEACGLVAVPELARTRTILLELERFWSHLNDIAAVCAGVGLATGNTRFAGLTERARRVNAAVTGHRFLFGAVRVGGSDLRLSHDRVRTVRAELAAIGVEARRSWRELLFNASFQDRLPGVGVLRPEDVRLLGTVGPAGRSAGSAEDVRAVSPRLTYEDFRPVLPEHPDGDVRARLEQRSLELGQSLEILDRLLDRPVLPAVAEAGGRSRPVGVGRVESPRGATSCVVERDGTRIARLRLRTGSYANWPSVAFTAGGALMPDFPLINKSFELCYACADR